MLVTKVDYFETVDGIAVLEALESMASSEDYFTTESYTPRSEELITFVETHQHYIRKHPGVNAQQYIANLKIMCRRRV